MLAEFGREMGFEVKVYPEMTLRGETVSSSQIRKLLPAAASAGPGIYWRGHSAFSARRAAAAATDRSTGGPSTWRAMKNSYRRTASTSLGHVSALNASIRSPTSEIVLPSARNYCRLTHLLNFHPIELTPETEVEICFLERLRDEIKPWSRPCGNRLPAT